jgi:hypothetical protein
MATNNPVILLTTTVTIMIIRVVLGGRSQEHEDIFDGGSVAFGLEGSIIPSKDVDTGKIPGHFVHAGFARHARFRRQQRREIPR